jgi:hypothetical protein
MKKLLLFVFLFQLSSLPFSAFACSCIHSPSGGYVSKITEGYVIFWGVPTQAKLVQTEEGRPQTKVEYKIQVLEGFERLPNGPNIVTSSVVDGASCGKQLIMGTPQFIMANKGRNDVLRVSSCMPDIPYKAINNYLTSGEDVFIPDLNECWLDSNEINTENPECSVWENYSPWTRFGDEDWFKYLKIWRERKRILNLNN